MGDRLLTLVARPEVEDRIVDLLLESGFAGFTSFPCAGHGVAPDSLSLAEQVAGRERRVGFWVHVDEQGARAILETLARSLGEAGIHFWIAPLVEQGHVGSASSP